MKTLKIGNVRIKNQLFLSPMVDVTNLPYRLLCRKYGAGMAYTEMINLGAILNENKKTLMMLRTTKEDKPIGLQVTGNNTEEFEKFKKLRITKNYDLIDLNCGCPSTRITNNQSGSYLLKKPEKIGRMIKTLKSEGLTVTAKIRLGYNKNESLRITRIIEKAGADAITVHARLANQKSSQPAKTQEIKKLRQEIGTPLIGNGDVTTGKKAAEMLDYTDGVMIGRAAIGNPKIFEQIKHYLRTGKEKEIPTQERLKSFQEYLKITKKHKMQDITRTKHLAGHFLKGFTGAAKTRQQIMKAKNIPEIQKTIQEIA